MNDVRVTPVEPLDSVGNRSRVRNEPCDPARGRDVPAPERAHQWCRHGLEWARQAVALGVEVPRVPHWRMAVTDVRDPVGDANGFGAGVAARDHDVDIANRSARVPGDRQEREEPRVVVDGARQMLEKRRLSGRKGGRNAIRRDQRRKEACTRERLQQLRDHTF